MKLRAFLVGIVNTLRVAVMGIVLATSVGTMVGIARPYATGFCRGSRPVYLEALRDVPLLLQFLFWYVLMQGLPVAHMAYKPIEGVYLSNRGLMLPQSRLARASSGRWSEHPLILARRSASGFEFLKA